jgi:hypothetical protein
MTSSSYTTNYNDSGTHTVTVTVSDGTLTDSQDVPVTVGGINRPPVLDQISDITVSEGATITLSPTATDPDGDALAYSYSGWMSSDSYTTGNNDAGSHTVTITVSDGTLTDSQIVTVIVLNSNNAPVLDPITDITVNEGYAVTLNPSAIDPDGDALAFTYTGWMTSDSYVTVSGDAGTHTVTVSVSDGILTDSQVVTITVVEKDKEPLGISNLTVASGETYEIVENGLQNGAVVYIDRGHTYSTVPTWLQGTTYINTANKDKTSSAASFISFDVNQDVIVYVAHDDRITMKPSWMTPFTDIGDDLIINGDNHSIFASNYLTGTITLGGNKGVSKSSMYTVIIVGQGNGSSNSAPVLDPITDITVNEGDTITFSPTATDPNGDTLSFSYTGWMSSISYTSNYMDVGTHTVTVTVSDGILTDSQDVMVTIIDVDIIQPSTPASLQATDIYSTKINLSWNASTDNVGVIGYRIYRDGSPVADVSSNTYKDAGLSKNTTYVYTVSAYDAAGNESSQSAPLVSNTKVPGRPTGMKIVGT